VHVALAAEISIVTRHVAHASLPSLSTSPHLRIRRDERCRKQKLESLVAFQEKAEALVALAWREATPRIGEDSGWIKSLGTRRDAPGVGKAPATRSEAKGAE